MSHLSALVAALGKPIDTMTFGMTYLQRVMLWNYISGVPTINRWYRNKHVASIQIFYILMELMEWVKAGNELRN